ncbi:prepilin peptidase [Patescibacteria group bacterium]|nr:prepilin peptidase [Patescibacteria group bacterium]
MLAILIFIIGLALGSFLSVVFTRLEIEGVGSKKPRKRSKKVAQEIMFGRSRCDYCKKQVAWYDNIPLISYLLLRGKCRNCGKPISEYHPVLELTSGLMLLASFLFFGLTWQFAVAGLFGLFMLLIFAYDLRHQIIPNVVVVPAIVLALVVLLYQFVLFSDNSSMQLTLWSADPESYLLGGGIIGLFFLVLSAISGGRWLGGGDIKLGALIGLILGWPYALVAIILSYLIGTFYAVVLLASRRADMKSSIAFGPAMVAGYFIAVFYGDVIVHWYQGLVL